MLNISMKTAQALLLIALLLLNSLAVSATDASHSKQQLAEGRQALQSPTGLLTGRGQIKINGQQVQSGATVLNGSIVATGADGVALINIGSLGRVEVRQDTQVVLMFSSNLLQVRTVCDRVHYKVTRGQFEVRSSDETKSLKAGNDATFKGATEGSSEGDTDLTIACREDDPTGFFWPGTGGILALLGIAVSIAAGIDAGSPDKQASPIRP